MKKKVELANTIVTFEKMKNVFEMAEFGHSKANEIVQNIVKNIEELIKLSKEQKCLPLNSPVFSMSISDAQGKMKMVDGKFVLLRGSLIRDKTNQSLPKGYAEFREQMIKENKIANYVVIQDISFNTPSGAAVMVAGSTMNGNTVWKLEDGKSFGEWKKEQESVK